MLLDLIQYFALCFASFMLGRVYEEYKQLVKSAGTEAAHPRKERFQKGIGYE